MHPKLNTCAILEPGDINYFIRNVCKIKFEIILYQGILLTFPRIGVPFAPKNLLTDFSIMRNDFLVHYELRHFYIF